jgi:hypothetical protein
MEFFELMHSSWSKSIQTDYSVFVIEKKGFLIRCIFINVFKVNSTADSLNMEGDNSFVDTVRAALPSRH